MPVGYLPDMFGHVAQMPQLLRQAGLEHAVVWRGVPAAVDRRPRSGGRHPTARACAPSTSTARTRTGATCPTTRSSSSRGPHGYELELGDVRLPGGGLLLMNGTDHQAAAAVARPRRRRGERGAGRLPVRRHVARPSTSPTSRPTGCTTWTGELRSGARANVLMGVASNRVDVHQVCAAAERAIERRAEPLSALLLPADALPARAARPRVAASSSSTARTTRRARAAPTRSSTQVVVRYQEARQIGDGLVRQALHALAAEVDAPPASTVVVNPTARRPRRADHRHRPGRRPGALRRARRRHAVPDAGRCATIGGDGFSPTRRRPEGPLGPRDDARPRVRRARASAATSSSAHDDVRRRHAATASGPSEPADRPRGAARGAARRSPRRTSRFGIRVQNAPMQRGDVRRPRRRPGSAGGRSRAADGDGPGDRRSTPATAGSPTSTSASRSTPATAPSRSRPTTACASPASAGSSTAATAATPTTTRRRPRTSSIDRPSR